MSETSPGMEMALTREQSVRRIADDIRAYHIYLREHPEANPNAAVGDAEWLMLEVERLHVELERRIKKPCYSNKEGTACNKAVYYLCFHCKQWFCDEHGETHFGPNPTEGEKRPTSCLMAENQRLRAITEQVKASLAHERVLFSNYLHDTSDGFECLDKCDSYGHEENCPASNSIVAWRQLREDLQAANLAHEQYREWAAGQVEQVKAHYLSTACFHEQHGNCRMHCKFCESQCSCDCHTALLFPL